jgi:hypothetical protein
MDAMASFRARREVCLAFFLVISVEDKISCCLNAVEMERTNNKVNAINDNERIKANPLLFFENNLFIV